MDDKERMREADLEARRQMFYAAHETEMAEQYVCRAENQIGAARRALDTALHWAWLEGCRWGIANQTGDESIEVPEWLSPYFVDEGE